MVKKQIAATLFFGIIVFGDTLTLKDGRKVQGTFLNGDSRQIRMAVEERVESYPITDVSEIKFGSPEPAANNPAREKKPPVVAEVARERTSGAAEASRTAREVPSGTSIMIRMIDDIDSSRDRVGQEFRASVDEAVGIGNETLIPRGANVVAKLVDDKQSGKLTGRTEVTVDLVSIEVDGRKLDIATQEVTQASESRTERTAKVAGGTAALGAIIGAIAGGGRGAAIGAVSGAAAGGAVQVITKGQQVRIPSETRLTFVLQQPLRLPEPR